MSSFWNIGIWLNEPPLWNANDEELTFTTGLETDFWRTTSYGFVHDTGHGLLFPLEEGASFDVTFDADYSREFDQAGILVFANQEYWIKCGVEFADGVFGLGAVVTSDVSDWSTAPHPDWRGKPVTVRVSRKGDALTIRARSGDGPWELVRLAPIDQALAWSAGPYAASPTGEGLVVTFRNPVWGEADASLH